MSLSSDLFQGWMAGDPGSQSGDRAMTQRAAVEVFERLERFELFERFELLPLNYSYRNTGFSFR